MSSTPILLTGVPGENSIKNIADGKMLSKIGFMTRKIRFEGKLAMSVSFIFFFVWNDNLLVFTFGSNPLIFLRQVFIEQIRILKAG